MNKELIKKINSNEIQNLIDKYNFMVKFIDTGAYKLHNKQQSETLKDVIIDLEELITDEEDE